MTTTQKQIEELHLAATEIEAKLNAKFPKTPFGIKTHFFKEITSAYIVWIDGPKTFDVQQEILEYEFGKYNGLPEIAWEGEPRKDIHQVNFVHLNRVPSMDTKQKIKEKILKDYEMKEWDNGYILEKFRTSPYRLFKAVFENITFS